MKNLLTATLPALALLALGGCATSGALTTSTENDGVYYSSSDRTTAVASPTPMAYGNTGTIPVRALDDTAPASTLATTDDANPDYQGGTAQGYATGTDYYSNTYNNGLTYYNPSGFNQPYVGPGVSSYNYSPAYAASPSYYGLPYGYSSAFGLGYSPFGYSPFSYGYSPFGYGGGFYDPFYSPFGYGYGSGLSIGFGYGFGGFGGFGYPYGYGSPFGYGYGSPYGYGYGRGYYDSYGYYGRPAGYGAGAVAGPAYTNPRVSRGGGSVFNGAAPANNGASGGRPVGSYSPNSVAMPGGTAAGGGMVMPTRRDGGGGGNVVGQPTYSTPGTSTGASAPGSASGSRRGFFGGFFGNGANPGQNTAAGTPGTGARGGWSQPQYSSGQGQAQRRDFGGQPAYGQPQQRTYSQPSQAQPSYSQPSRSFGGGSFGGGGGGFGGGGGGGGRRGGR